MNFSQDPHGLTSISIALSCPPASIDQRGFPGAPRGVQARSHSFHQWVTTVTWKATARRPLVMNASHRHLQSKRVIPFSYSAKHRGLLHKLFDHVDLPLTVRHPYNPTYQNASQYEYGQPFDLLSFFLLIYRFTRTRSTRLRQLRTTDTTHSVPLFRFVRHHVVEQTPRAGRGCPGHAYCHRLWYVLDALSNYLLAGSLLNCPDGRCVAWRGARSLPRFC